MKFGLILKNSRQHSVYDKIFSCFAMKNNIFSIIVSMCFVSASEELLIPLTLTDIMYTPALGKVLYWAMQGMQGHM